MTGQEDTVAAGFAKAAAELDYRRGLTNPVADKLREARMTEDEPPSFPTTQTRSGRTIIVCYCGGGSGHEWKPNGRCPSRAPQPMPFDDLAKDLPS